MKKIISLLLVFIFIALSAFSVMASGEKETLMLLEILPSGYDAENAYEFATRGEFAYMTAKLLDGDVNQKTTPFADVDASNPYSGAVAYLHQLGAVSGTGNGNFNVDEDITLFAAAKILTVALGYGDTAEKNGGFPYGYIDILNYLGILKGIAVSQNGMLTKKDAANLIYTVLTKELKAVSYINGEDGMTTYIDGDAKEPIIESRFNLRMVCAVVTDVSQSGSSLTFKVEKAENTTDFPIDSTLTLSVDDNIIAAEYENVPCIIWVDENNTVVKITPQKNVTVKYATIVSINGSKTINYPIENIEELFLLDDETEYHVAENATLKYNGAYTMGAPDINGNYARIVIVNDEVTHIESWKLEDGGFITNFDGNTIVYQNGTNEARLRDLSSYKNQLVIVEGKTASLMNVKIFSTFSYYISDDSVVLVVSEKKASDILHSVSASEMQIGGMIYSKENDVYCSLNGKTFSLNNFSNLYGEDVCAYIGWDGYVKYVTNGPNSTPMNKVYAVIAGVNRDLMDKKCAEIKLLVVENGSVSKRKYNITKKTNYNSLGLSLDVLASTSNDLEGNGVYLFEFNNKGEVVTVENPSWLHGYGEAKTNITYFDDYNLVRLNNKGLFLNQSILVIYEEKGEFTAKIIPASYVTGKTLRGVATLAFYGKERSIEPDLIVLTGDVYGMSRYTAYGVLTEIWDVIDENGEMKK